MTLLFPKPQRQKKEPKALKRSPIKKGRRCPECWGKGFMRPFTGLILPEDFPKERLPDLDRLNRETCPTCQGTGRVDPRPLQRARKAIRNDTSDLSEFDKKLLRKIWSDDLDLPFPAYPYPNEQMEFHHILGRKKDEKMYSSPYNALPVPRKIHDKGWITKPEAKALFLYLARMQVDKAISRGLYEFTDNDACFKEYAFEHLSRYFPTEGLTQRIHAEDATMA